MAPPMPPVAPVTRAVLPVRSNISVLLRALLAKASRSAGAFSGAASASGAMRLTMPDSTLPAPASAKRVDAALARQPQHALAPAHAAGDLFDQQPADRLRDQWSAGR